MINYINVQYNIIRVTVYIGMIAFLNFLLNNMSYFMGGVFHLLFLASKF